MGTWNDKKLAVAAQYLSFLGTADKSAEDITKEFYKIACSFNVSAGTEYTTVLIEGLQENFEKAVALFENVLENCKADEKALASLKARIAKSRTDAKANKGGILNGLTAYARFGANNPFNYTMSDEELKNLTAAELVNTLHNLNQYPHQVMYYGPQALPALTASIKKVHKIPAAFAKAPAKVDFKPVTQSANQVLFADYNMVQAETRWIRNSSLFNVEEEATVNMFNNYFGGGMGALVFQTIRESKALAYSTFAVYVSPEKKTEPYFTIAYVGSQADKFNEAVVAMNELLNDIPEISSNIEFAKNSIKKDIETQRITQDGIIFNFLDAEQKGLKEDLRIKKYAAVDKIGYPELKAFHAKYIAGKPYTYAVLASEKSVKAEDLQKLGEVKKLSLQEVFGY
jgi:predicted Zn-dependent peptidase